MKFAALTLFVVGHCQKISHSCTTLYPDQDTRDNWHDQCRKACEPYKTMAPENATDKAFLPGTFWESSCMFAGMAHCACFDGALNDCSVLNQGKNRGYCCPT